MNTMIKRSLALLMVLVMCLSFLPVLHIRTSAADVNYVYSGKYLYNWGTRGTTATFLSPNAEKFYAANKTYDELAANSGGTSVSNAPSSALYSALKKLMTDNHDHITSYAETRDLYKFTDCQNSGGSISCFYTGKAIGPAWDGGSTWNREHTWPNSKGLGGNDENDIMMLRPTDSSTNSSRGNKAYGESSGYYDPNKASGGKHNLHGDVARIVLYVYVRWGNTSYAWGQGGVMENLDVLLKWMEEDPVDTWELGRNDSVEAITGTRNVFVDYPEFGFLLFGEDVPENMQTPSGEGNSDCGHNNFGAGVTTAPTCTENGFTTYTCQTAGCGYTRKANIVVAIGHNFAAGVCVTCGAAEPSKPTYVKEIKTNTPYKLGIFSTNKNAEYYFTGTMSGYYGATDTSYDNSVNVYVEQTTGGYHLYFNDSNNQKQYINLKQNSTHYNFTYATTASSVFTWDAEKYSFYTTVGSETCYIGTYGDYVTMGTIKVSGMKDTDYFARFYEVSAGTTPKPDPDPSCQHNYQDGICTLCGDVKRCEHSYQNGVCTLCGKTQPQNSEANITFDSGKSNRTEYSETIQVWVQNGITVTNEKASSSSNVGDYANPGRFYKGSKVTIAYPGMTKIVINCTGLEAKYREPWKAIQGDATVSENGGIITITFDTPVDSFVYPAMSAQGRAYDITVYAAQATECTHPNTRVEGATEPTCAAEGSTGKTYCSDCDELLNAGVAIPKVDHECGKWEVFSAPTCTARGAERRDCNNCDYYETREVAQLEHSYSEDNVCNTCGKQSGSNITPPTTDVNNDIANIITNLGCNNVIGGSSLTVIALVSVAAIVFTKKKED